MPDRVVDEDDDELSQAVDVAAERDGLGVDPNLDTGLAGDRREPTGGVQRQLAEIGRAEVELDRPGIRSSEYEEVLDEGRQALRSGVDVVEGRPNLGDRLVAIAPEVLDAAPHDREPCSQLVAGIRGKLALSPHRVADRDEGPFRVQPADAERRGQRAES